MFDRMFRAVGLAMDHGGSSNIHVSIKVGSNHQRTSVKKRKHLNRGRDGQGAIWNEKFKFVVESMDQVFHGFV